MFCMRTDIMINMSKKSNGFTLDACFLIQAYKNPPIASFCLNRGFYDSKILINEISLNEAEYLGFDKTEILLKMKTLFDKIIVKDVTNEERIFGQKLENMCSILHAGDSAILAFAKRTSSTLVTFDKKLAQACRFFDVNCILFQTIQTGGTTNAF